MTNESLARQDRRDFPLRRAELQRSKLDQTATGDIPDKLQAIDLLPSPAAFEHASIQRRALAGVSGEPVIPFRPQWVGSVTKPRLASFPGQVKRKLWHRGVELDPLFIWGADDRKIYSDTRYPWGCVCRVVTQAGAGSGVIVGPRHVLTASHVVDWSSGAGTVEVHRAGPAVSAVSPITKVWYFTKLSPPEVGWSEVDEDYAVLITATRLGDRFGGLGVRTYNSDWDDEPYWFNVGYPSDIAGGMFPVYQRYKELDEDEFDYGSGRSMTTSADTAPGQSGGPLFAFWGDGPYAVAVVSAQGTYFLSGSENWCSGGSDLTRLVKHARAADP